MSFEPGVAIQPITVAMEIFVGVEDPTAPPHLPGAIAAGGLDVSDVIAVRGEAPARART